MGCGMYISHGNNALLIQLNVFTSAEFILLSCDSQVKTRCRSEWAEFQARLTNADKVYLKGLRRIVRG